MILLARNPDYLSENVDSSRITVLSSSVIAKGNRMVGVPQADNAGSAPAAQVAAKEG